MRKLRTRLTMSLILLVIITSILSLMISGAIEAGLIFERDLVRYFFFGYALKDIVLLVLSVAILAMIVFFTAKRSSNPIIELNNATKEVTAGNFDVRVNIPDRSTEVGQLSRNFNLMVEELQGNVYLKEDFVSSVSHQFKTPLAIIQGYSRLLEDEGVDEDKKREYAALITRESDKLIKLTGNMLRLAKIDRQMIPEMVKTFSLDEQIRQAILLLEPRWSEKNLELDVDLAEVEFTGEEELISQIWVNLLDNAIKFTPEGRNISVIMESTEDKAVIKIRNDGENMDEETLSRLFDQFYQGSSLQKSDGCGLGLTIVRKIVEIHKGTISAANADGAEFTVVFPLKNGSDRK